MNDQSWLRLLELVRRELGAEDAFVQIGGDAWKAPQSVSVPLSGTRRLVAVMAEGPAEPEALREKLLALCDAFHSTTESDDAEEPRVTANASRSELDHALADVASRARAEAAMVFDIDSPVIWGCSAVDGRELDLVQLNEAAEIDRCIQDAGLRWDTLLDRDEEATLAAVHAQVSEDQHGTASRVAETLHALWVEHGRHAVHRRLRMARAIRSVRTGKRRNSDPPGDLTVREAELNCVMREFATIYRILLVFGQPFSPLHAEAAMQRNMDYIERLVLALPPVDPGGGRKAKAARVLRLV